MLFDAIRNLNGGNVEDYYKDWQYPLDLNGSLDFMRPQTGVSPMPYPQTIGYFSRLLPFMDRIVWTDMRGKTPFGPFIGTVPYSLDAIFPSINGGLAKAGG